MLQRAGQTHYNLFIRLKRGNFAKRLKMQSPIDFFSSLTDPRMDRCKLYKLSDILFITIAACLSGAEDWEEIEELWRSEARMA